MRKYQLGIIIFVVLSLLLLIIPSGCYSIKLEQNQVRSNQDPMIDFYAHFDDDYQENPENYMNTHPENDQKVTLKNLAVNLDNVVKFNLIPNMVSDIHIADSAPTGGELDKFLHARIYLSASRITERVIQTVSVGTELDPEYYGTDKITGAVGVNPSSNSFNFKCNQDILEKDHQLIFTIRTQYTGATPTSFHMHTGPSWPTHMGVRYTNKLKVEVSTSIDEKNQTLTVTAKHDNPLGDDNMKFNASTFSCTGETTPKSITHNEKSFIWEWDYSTDDAVPGKYTATITVEDLQGNTASNAAIFYIPKDKEAEKEEKEESKVPGFETIFVISGVLILIFIFKISRKK